MPANTSIRDQNTNMSDNKIEQVRKVLGTPFSGDLPDNAIRVRRNLMAASLIAIILVLSGAKVDPASTLLGIRFTNLKGDHVSLGLLALNVYFFIHYFWYVVEAWLEWRLRLTGTRLAFQTGASFGSEYEDHHTDPRQSTLYNWWIAQGQSLGGLETYIDTIGKKISKFETQLSNPHRDSNDLDTVKVAADLESIKTNISSLQDHLKSINGTIKSARILASLERFDKWFYLSLRIQSVRWILIDLSFPILLGLAANGLLAYQIIVSDFLFGGATLKL